MADRYLLESGAPDGYLLEDSSGVLLLEGPVPGDHDENSWWAGINFCSVGVAIAGAALALATSVSVANTIVQNGLDETFVPAMGGGVLKDEAKVFRWYQGDDLVAAVTPLADDTVGWTIYVPPKEPKKTVYLPDAEEIPAGSLFGVPTEGDFIPSPIQPTPFLWVGQWQDEIGTPAFTPEENYWAQLPFSPEPPKNLVWLANDERPTPPTTIVDEDYWWVPPPVTITPLSPIWTNQAEWVVPPASFTPSEEDWQVKLTPVYDPTIVVWAVTEDLVPQPAAVVDGGGGVIKDEVWVVRWYQGDDLPIPPAPLPFDEDYWLNLIPQPSTLSTWVGVDEGLIVFQPLPFIEEEYWAFPVPPWEKAVVSGPNWDNADLFWTLEETEYQPAVFLPPVIRQIWASEEEIVPQPPISTFADEDFWAIPRQWEAASFITTFTADDEIGDFVTPPVIQVVETDGVRKKKRKHPKEAISELVDEVVQERTTPPPEPRPELEGLEQNEQYRIVPVYKPSIGAIPLSPPAAPPEEDDDEIVAYLVSIGML